MLKPALRERLLGALVFLCLGLIFYPVIFDTRSEFVIDRQSQIPTQLVEVSPLTLAEPAPPEGAEPPAIAEEVFLPDPETDQLNPELEAGGEADALLDESGRVQAWVLQVGSFSQEANASELENSLLEAGFRAYRRHTETGGSELYRVLVGPYLDPAIARRDMSQIRDETASEPILLDFSP